MYSGAKRDLTGALASYRATHGISARLAAADPGNDGWQRDLAVSQLKIGEVLGQGDLTGALTSYRASLEICAGWLRPTQATPAGNTTSRPARTKSAVCSAPGGHDRGVGVLPRESGNHSAASGGRPDKRRRAERLTIRAA